MSFDSFKITHTRDSDEVKEIVRKASLKNPGVYYTVENWFGPVVFLHKRLHVFAPTSSVFGGYWLNGKFKRFTEKQRIADSNATPILSQSKKTYEQDP